MFNIELDIFSGRVNPQWDLTQSEQNTFLEMIIEDNLPILPVNVVESKLGYRGFIVRASLNIANTLIEKGLPNEFRVNANLAGVNQITGKKWLLDSIEQQGLNIPEEAKEVAYDEIQAESTLDEGKAFNEEKSLGASCTYHVTSSTNFDFWNANSSHRLNNNCYNYCYNWRTNTFAQPGRGTGQIFTSLTMSNITNAAKRDGYKDSCSGSNLRVALVIWPNIDYHWYRRTASVGGSERWCHKPGKTSATNVDNSGNFITSPYSCNRGNYTTWGGYLYGPGSSRQTVA